MTESGDMKAVSYRVTATVNKIYKDEYVSWLSSGHVQAVVEAGGLSADVIVLDEEIASIETRITDDIQVVSSYIFPSREALQAYFDGPAAALRIDGKEKFIDTNKVSKFERSIGEVIFHHTR